MTREEAQTILLRYRPGIPVIDDPELAGALDLAREDRQLGEWLALHTEFQKKVTAELRAAAPPAYLREQILSRSGTSIPKRPLGRYLAIAAGLAVLGISALFFFRAPSENQSLDAMRSRMLGFVQREYRMDIVTNDLSVVRQFLRNQSAPADFALTTALQEAPVKGAARLSWQGHPIAMVCFGHPSGEILYLFVLDSAAFDRDSLLSGAGLRTVNTLASTTWIKDDKLYLLAGAVPSVDLQKYLALKFGSFFAG